MFKYNFKKVIIRATIMVAGVICMATIHSCKKITQDTLTYAAFGPEDFLIESNNEITITNFRGDNGKTVIIPSAYKGIPITAIADNVFNYQELLKKHLRYDEETGELLNPDLKTTLAMEKIDLPANIKKIGTKAFAMPSLLQVRSFNPTPPVLGNSVFVTDQTLIIFVPANSLTDYQTQWTSSKVGTANIEWKTL